jgi:renalase
VRKALLEFIKDQARCAVDYDVIIVGAGLSGLVAARELQQAGKKIAILDKGRSVGGRLATRRLGDGRADHGAQFFTVRTPEFQAQADRWLADDVIRVWSYGWSDGSLKRTPIDGHPRYVANEGMNQLARHIEAELTDVDIFTETHVRQLDDIETEWCVTTHDQCAYTAGVLLLTPPVPQSLALLGSLDLGDVRTALERIQYGPCLCGLFVLDGEPNLPDPGGIQRFGETMYWLADNQRKGISDTHIITIHAEQRWSRQYYDADDTEVLRQMADHLRPFLPDSVTIQDSQLKKWRYSVPLTTHPDDYVWYAPRRLAFAGDAFGGRGRIEGAFLSGLAVGQALVNALQNKSIQ